MQTIQKTTYSFCLALVSMLNLGMACAAPPPSDIAETDWLSRTIRAYRQAKQNVPDFKQANRNISGISVAVKGLYAQHSPGSMQATAIAYWGALRLDNTDYWITQMEKANRLPRAASEEEDALQCLPDALVTVYKARKAASALKSLIRLNLDGSYGEILDYARFPLFLSRPLDFAHVMRQIELETKTESRQWEFTHLFIFRLRSDEQLRRKTRELVQRYARGKNAEERFLFRYLSHALRVTSS